MATQLRCSRFRGADEGIARRVDARVAPLRPKWGFSIPAAWVVEETNEFVWLLRYDGPEGFEARDEAYYASDDRKSLNPDPARYIASADTRFGIAVWPR